MSHHIEVFHDYETAEIHGEAMERYLRYKDADTPKIVNTEMGHFVGRMGEVATFRYFFRLGYQPMAGYHDPKDKQPDIVLGDGRTMEIKTWQERHYYDLGRAIVVSQWSKIETYNYIVWCSVLLHHSRPFMRQAMVTIHGFSTPAKFASLAQRVRKGKGSSESYQVKPEQINDLDLFGGINVQNLRSPYKATDHSLGIA